jgi:predicted GNAT family N-acyltransferase
MNAIVNPAVFARATPTHAAVQISVARSLDELLQIFALRAVIYMGDQACPYEEEFDGNDFNATHLIARIDGRAVGTLRLRWFAEFVKLERVAIDPGHRGGKVLKALFSAAFDHAARKGYRKAIGHMQVRLLPLWTRVLGITPRAGRPGFVFSDHQYLEVEKTLEPPQDALTQDSDPLVLVRPEGEWDRPGVLDLSCLRQATNPGA